MWKRMGALLWLSVACTLATVQRPEPPVHTAEP